MPVPTDFFFTWFSAYHESEENSVDQWHFSFNAMFSLCHRLCLPVPIDVVYTWVNGTDSQLIMNLKRVKYDMEEEFNVSRSVFYVKLTL